jgi:uncharacterized membrane protein (UPF0127 family)
VSAAGHSLLTLSVLLAALTGCRSGGRTDRGDGRPGAARVIVESPSGRSSEVRVEVARTQAEVARGLMFREKLGPDEGMLFVFPDSSEHAFWMKNTPLPLDMIFADEEGVVVGVVENAEPFTTVTRGVGAPSRYVLEVNAGWSAAHGVTRGDRMRFEGVAGLR